MKNKGYIDNGLDLFQKIQFQFRFKSLRIKAMSCTDCDSKTIYTCLLYKFLCICRIRVDNFTHTACLFCIIVSRADRTKFSFHRYTKRMSKCHYSLCNRHIFFIRAVRSIYHNGSKTISNGSFNLVIALTMIQMNCNRHSCVVCSLDHLSGKSISLECQFIGMDCQNNRCFLLFAHFNNCFQKLSGPHIKCRYCKILFIGYCQ